MSKDFDIVNTDAGKMIECGRCGQKMDYAEQAEGCRDPDCPMKFHSKRPAETYGAGNENL